MNFDFRDLFWMCSISFLNLSCKTCWGRHWEYWINHFAGNTHTHYTFAKIENIDLIKYLLNWKLDQKKSEKISWTRNLIGDRVDILRWSKLKSMDTSWDGKRFFAQTKAKIVSLSPPDLMSKLSKALRGAPPCCHCLYTSVLTSSLPEPAFGVHKRLRAADMLVSCLGSSVTAWDGKKVATEDICWQNKNTSSGSFDVYRQEFCVLLLQKAFRNMQ